MSNILKTIGKIALAVVAVAAVLWTAGAVAPALLGSVAPSFTAAAAAAGGGFAGAAAGLATTLGLSGTLGGIVAGAVTYAGYGAVAGGIMSAVAGKNVLNGMVQGAGIGAVTGGVIGAFNPLPGTGAPVTTGGTAGDAANAAKSGVPDASSQTGVTGLPGTNGAADVTNVDMSNPGAAAPITMGAAPPPLLPAGSLAAGGGDQAALINALKPTTFQTIAPIAGGAISGIGAGLGGAAQASAALQGQQNQFDQTQKNYSTGVPGLTQTTTQTAGAGLPTPVQRFASNFTYEYDPGQGKVVQVPVQGY